MKTSNRKLETTFSFEKDLQEFVSMNIESIEDRLSLVDREYNIKLGEYTYLQKINKITCRNRIKS
ncbi:hypothetical protein DRP05_08885 [Archaeoglobales archaeon]|nr:MAG: hypothetical protein DRP05_08885 [Archaeoglobales archaeon]